MSLDWHSQSANHPVHPALSQAYISHLIKVYIHVHVCRGGGTGGAGGAGAPPLLKLGGGAQPPPNKAIVTSQTVDCTCINSRSLSSRLVARMSKRSSSTAKRTNLRPSRTREDEDNAHKH